MDSQEERMQILELIDRGKISVEDGLRLLQALDDDDAQQDDLLQDPDGTEANGWSQLEETQASGLHHGVAHYDIPDAGETIPVQEPFLEGETAFRSGSEATPLPNIEKFRRFWIIPFLAGISVTFLGGLLMFAVIQASGIFIGLVCAGAPFFIGLVLTILAWLSRTAHWMHLRVQQKPGERPERISLSFPFPIRLSAWFFRTFRYKIPQLEHTAVDEIILALGKATSPDNPLFIQVDEGEGGEKVQIFIG